MLLPIQIAPFFPESSAFDDFNVVFAARISCGGKKCYEAGFTGYYCAPETLDPVYLH